MRVGIARHIVLALALCPVASGCASIFDLTEGPRIYGGVLIDTAVIVEAFREGQPGAMGNSIAKGFLPFAVLDLPLSLAMDTALLPVTVPIHLLRDPEEGEEEGDESDEPVGPGASTCVGFRRFDPQRD